MSLKINKYTQSVMATLALIFILSACDGNTTLSTIGDKIDQPPTPVATGTYERPAADENGIITYPNYQIAIARTNDTVMSMAIRVGVTANKLATYNGLKPQARLQKDEVLAIPTDEILSTTGAIEDIASFALDSAPSSITKVQQDNEPVRHTVRSGETAYTIANLYNVSVTELASWNGLGPELSVRNGQRLLIPKASSLVKPPILMPPNPKITDIAPQKALSKLKPLRLTESSNSNTISSKKMIKPVIGKILRSFSKKSGGNEGIDYAVLEGTKVKAAASGTVALISKSVGNTTIILLRHENNLYTVYSNITDVKLDKDTIVNAGDIVGLVGPGDPPFLHFEVRKGTEAVDPAPYL